MKKQTIIFLLLVLGSIWHSQAQSFNECIEYIYQIPSYHLKDTVLPLEYGVSQTFSFIEIYDNKHDETDSIGFPLLPQFLLNLNVPRNAYNYVFTLTINQVDTFHVSNALIPAQEDMLENDTIANFSMNSSFYLSTDTFLNFNPILLEEYITFGEKGILLAINPFRYIPNEGLVMVLTNAVIMVTYMLERDENENNSRKTLSTEQYFKQMFENYPITHSLENQDKENYLIITAPEFENMLSDFVQHKRNIGYNVIIVNTNTIGTSSYSIKSYIQNLYNNISTRPEYVLLVGDIDKIPASAGSEEDIDNPISDLEYSLLEGNDEKADVYLGRFSVQNNIQLENVISKIICMENNMHTFSKLATLVSGHFDGQRSFKKVQEEIRPYLERLGYTCQKIYDIDGSTYLDAVNALSNNNLYYIYRGHGNNNQLAICQVQNNMNYCGPNCSDISSSNAQTFPIFLSIACYSGNYAKPNCFGECCLRNQHGASAFLGATVKTYRDKNNKMQKHIFSHFSENLTLSSWLQIGINNFYKPSHERKRHIRAYNLLGDPSFRLNGVDCFFNYIFTQNVNVTSGNILNKQAEHLIRNDNTFLVNNGASVYLQAGDEILLTNGFFAAEGSDFEAVIAPCSGRAEQQSQVLDNTPPLYGYNRMPQQDSSGTSLLEAQVEQRLQVWPNPVSGTLHIQLPDAEKEMVGISVCDLLGRVMLQKENFSTKTELDVSTLSRGMYIIQVRTLEGKSMTAKFMKE